MYAYTYAYTYVINLQACKKRRGSSYTSKRGCEIRTYLITCTHTYIYTHVCTNYMYTQTYHIYTHTMHKSGRKMIKTLTREAKAVPRDEGEALAVMVCRNNFAPMVSFLLEAPRGFVE